MKRWNPFNSYKLLVHTERWQNIRRGRPIPPPVLITVDPANACNFDCAWCNASYIRKHRNFMLSSKALQRIADFLPRWGETYTKFNYDLKAICIAGGGEPLINPHTPEFIDQVRKHNIEIGMVTNGSRIHECIDALSQLTWVGVSVDAGNNASFSRLKGLDPDKNIFGKVLDNISLLVEYSKSHHSWLGKNHPSYGISYKYLLYKDNIPEVFAAAKLAKEIGCKAIHFRPAGTTWDNINGEQQIEFTHEDIEMFEDQISQAMELDDENFSVFGVTHKFNSQFCIANEFNNCYAIFMTSVISPRSSKESSPDAYTLSLCCDRRGDSTLELLKDTESVDDINKVWGSERHWRIFDQIDIKSCPRCTYQPHNQIYENVILNDSMTYKFI